ncbi:MAG: N-acetyltransferase [Microbacteriaceae bacterium]|nr:N-acetyltransferase [Microbacteriaceae bacterium]
MTPYDVSEYSYSKDASNDRYLVHHDDEVAGFMSYHRRPDGTVVVDHTIVDQAHQNQGIAGRLVGFGLRDLEATTEAPIIATCDYVNLWLRRNPEYAEQLAARGHSADQRQRGR